MTVLIYLDLIASLSQQSLKLNNSIFHSIVSLFSFQKSFFKVIVSVCDYFVFNFQFFKLLAQPFHFLFGILRSTGVGVFCLHDLLFNWRILFSLLFKYFSFSSPFEADPQSVTFLHSHIFLNFFLFLVLWNLSAVCLLSFAWSLLLLLLIVMRIFWNYSVVRFTYKVATFGQLCILWANIRWLLLES